MVKLKTAKARKGYKKMLRLSPKDQKAYAVMFCMSGQIISKIDKTMLFEFIADHEIKKKT